MTAYAQLGIAWAEPVWVTVSVVVAFVRVVTEVVVTVIVDVVDETAAV